MLKRFLLLPIARKQTRQFLIALGQIGYSGLQVSELLPFCQQVGENRLKIVVESSFTGGWRVLGEVANTSFLGDKKVAGYTGIDATKYFE